MLSGAGSSKESLSRLVDFIGFLSSFALCFLLFKRSCLERQRHAQPSVAPEGGPGLSQEQLSGEQGHHAGVTAHLPQPLLSLPQPTPPGPDDVLPASFPGGSLAPFLSSLSLIPNCFFS